MTRDAFAKGLAENIAAATATVREFGRLLGSEWGACSSCGVPLTPDRRPEDCPFGEGCLYCEVCHRQSVWSQATVADEAALARLSGMFPSPSR